jgi:hypothetical protein
MFPNLHLIELRVPDDASTWVARMEAACAVMEGFFPGQPLVRASVPRKVQAQDIPVTDRRAYFRERLRTKTRWLALGNEVPADWDGAGYPFIGVGGKLSSATPAVFDASCTFGAQPWDRSAQVLAAAGDALQAWTADLPTVPSQLRLRRIQMGHGDRLGPDPLEGRLPRLRYWLTDKLDAPQQPPMLAWLNYWSPATCEWLGFPDTSRDERLLRLSFRTPRGAWIVQLTPEPLDLDRPDHVEAAAWAYERFPRLGPRA